MSIIFPFTPWEKIWCEQECFCIGLLDKTAYLSNETFRTFKFSVNLFCYQRLKEELEELREELDFHKLSEKDPKVKGNSLFADRIVVITVI